MSIKKYLPNKFYYSNFILSQNKGFLNKFINFIYLIKLLLNQIIKLLINIEIIIKKKCKKKKNVKINKSKTCYILGSGPSAKENMKLFEGKDTFVSNFFFQHKDIKTLRPKYYCLLDGKTFNPTRNGDALNNKNFSKKSYLMVRNLTKKINNNCPNAKIILPFEQAHASQEKFNFFNPKNIIYINNLSFDMADHIPKKLDISVGIPFSLNVVPWKICLAIVMGYKKIILYGCEQDIFINFKHAFKTKNQIFNIRKKFDNLKKKNNYKYELYPDTSNYISIYLTLNILKCHLNLNSYAKKKRVKIINCTPAGILDVYETDNIKNNL